VIFTESKICSRCKIEKPISNFSKLKNGNYHNYCSKCSSEKCKEYREKNKKITPPIITSKICSKCKIEKPISEFVVESCLKSGYRGMCKECTSITNNKRQEKRIATGFIKKETKICSSCKIEYPISNFSKRIALPDGLNIYCKYCEKLHRSNRIENFKNEGYIEKETKLCAKCKETKPISEFNKQASSKDGYRPHCRECQKLDRKKSINKRLLFGYVQISEKTCTQCNQTKPIDQFMPEKTNSTGHTAWCIECLYALNDEYREKNREKLRLYAKNYRIENQEACNQWQREFRKTPEGKIAGAIHHHRRKTRLLQTPATLTLEQWLKIIADQENECNICHKPFNKKRFPHRDHIIPLTKGGGLTFENVQALCKSCNSKKYNNLDKQNIVTWLHPKPIE
jgi:hypothetical protein